MALKGSKLKDRVTKRVTFLLPGPPSTDLSTSTPVLSKSQTTPTTKVTPQVQNSFTKIRMSSFEGYYASSPASQHRTNNSLIPPPVQTQSSSVLVPWMGDHNDETQYSHQMVDIILDPATAAHARGMQDQRSIAKHPPPPPPVIVRDFAKSYLPARTNSSAPPPPVFVEQGRTSAPYQCSPALPTAKTRSSKTRSDIVPPLLPPSPPLSSISTLTSRSKSSSVSKSSSHSHKSKPKALAFSVASSTNSSRSKGSSTHTPKSHCIIAAVQTEKTHTHKSEGTCTVCAATKRVRKIKRIGGAKLCWNCVRENFDAEADAVWWEGHD